MDQFVRSQNVARSSGRLIRSVHPEDIHWVRGGIENPTRPEKIAVDLPRGVRLDDAPEGDATMTTASLAGLWLLSRAGILSLPAGLPPGGAGRLDP